ncbi:MAG TPA: OB-fold domain-containing protein [Thermoplasmata archaeon]|nr:OB-fold domain-containing protein [Thermoplasmata archaeon]
MSEPPIDLSRCETCRAQFVPTDGACPRCGSLDVHSYPSSALGTVLAATELTNPPTGWTPPHRLALVELPESVRVLAIVDGPLPAPGTLVSLRLDGAVFRAASEPTA